MKSFTFKLFFIGLVLLIAAPVFAQDTTNTPFGKGLINVTAKDKSWSSKMTVRIQTRYAGAYDYADETYSDRMFVRRARIKGSGHVFSPKVKYKIEYDVHNGFVLDAVVKWNFAGNWTVWFGQTKLPGNIERVFSSQKLQLVDRSLLNSSFTLDRDAGIQLRHHFTLGEKFLIREIFAISQGEGLNQVRASNGYGYTGRLELLPFGKFTGKGDYFAADLKREKTPKLMLACTYDVNQNAMRSRGQRGVYISNTDDLRNLQSLFVDAHFKYRGFSTYFEYANRKADDGPNVTPLYDENGDIEEGFYSYYTGSSVNVQAGYLLKSNWEVAGRYTQVTPEAATGNNNLTQYTVGLSRYVVGHNLKVQGDIGLTQEASKDDDLFVRLQVELTL